LGAALEAIKNELQVYRVALEVPMLELQTRLRRSWDVLQVPAELRAEFEWDSGRGLSEELVEECEKEALRLERWMTQLAPVLGEVDPRVLGKLMPIVFSNAKKDCEEEEDEVRADAVKEAAEIAEAVVRQRATKKETEEVKQVALLRQEQEQENAIEAARAAEARERKLRASQEAAELELEEVRKAMLVAQEKAEEEVKERERQLLGQLEQMESQKEAELRALKEREATQERAHAEMLAQAQAHAKAAAAKTARQMAMQKAILKTQQQTTKAKSIANITKERQDMVIELTRKEEEAAAAVAAASDRRDIEAREQMEAERQHREAEKQALREEVEALHVSRMKLLEDAHLFLNMLVAGERLVKDFDKVHNKNAVTGGGRRVSAKNLNAAESQPPPVSAADATLRLRVEVQALTTACERLKTRCDSDGLFVALRNTMKKNVWRATELANQITNGPSALKGGDGNTISYEQLTHWLNAKAIPFTDAGMEFFLLAVGSEPPKGKKAGGAESGLCGVLGGAVPSAAGIVDAGADMMTSVATASFAAASATVVHSVRDGLNPVAAAASSLKPNGKGRGGGKPMKLNKFLEAFNTVKTHVIEW